ncbi:hypothetical protein EYF80_048984 [Liparis tanakae]|uniref:Uncharacterized protein n=1 Tax=Liparis tanakae TaxID=230148 RepID=A0A4Z2FIU9_9TELE|nr:hypothetical protein EYF80_048984 [Liparis tanakae]
MRREKTDRQTLQAHGPQLPLELLPPENLVILLAIEGLCRTAQLHVGRRGRRPHRGRRVRRHLRSLMPGVLGATLGSAA